MERILSNRSFVWCVCLCCLCICWLCVHKNFEEKRRTLLSRLFPLKHIYTNNNHQKKNIFIKKMYVFFSLLHFFLLFIYNVKRKTKIIVKSQQNVYFVLNISVHFITLVIQIRENLSLRLFSPVSFRFGACVFFLPLFIQFPVVYREMR